MSKKAITFAFFLIFSMLLFFGWQTAGAVQNTDKQLKVYLFWANGCPHCEKEKEYLASIQQRYSNVKIELLEVTENKNNLDLLNKASDSLNANVTGVPFTVVGKSYLIGWYDDRMSGSQLDKMIEDNLANGCEDFVGGLFNPSGSSCTAPVEKKSNIPDSIQVPFFGKINIKSMSLPLISLVIGGIDGFNPCAMWALIFLVSLLLGFGSKKRLVVLGGAFLLTEALIYYLFMTAWLNVFLFIGFVFWIRLLIGSIALYMAYVNLRDFASKKDPTCLVESDEKKKKFFDRLNGVVHGKNLGLAFLGIIALALSINIVEMVCSLGLPAVYTQILAINNLSALSYNFYMAIYIIAYMADDIIIYFIAVFTMNIIAGSAKYARFSHLVGGVLMAIIGLLMLFKPDWLMFG